MKKLLPLLLVVFAGCMKSWSPVNATSPNELYVLAETLRFGGLHGWREVRGEIAAQAYIVPSGAYNCDKPAGCVAAAWYQSGIAYYYQEFVNETTEANLTDVANHEVCHHDYRLHDLAHWKCMNRFGSPTYPQPSKSGVWEGDGFAFIPGIREGALER